jgi:hypothetical protein
MLSIWAYVFAIVGLCFIGAVIWLWICHCKMDEYRREIDWLAEANVHLRAGEDRWGDKVVGKHGERSVHW